MYSISSSIDFCGKIRRGELSHMWQLQHCGQAGVSGDMAISTGDATTGDSSAIFMTSGHGSTVAGGDMTLLVVSTDSGTGGAVFITAVLTLSRWPSFNHSWVIRLW